MWTTEETLIRGCVVFIIYYDGSPRGNITTMSDDEARKWRDLLSKLNDGQRDNRIVDSSG